MNWGGGSSSKVRVRGCSKVVVGGRSRLVVVVR